MRHLVLAAMLWLSSASAHAQDQFVFVFGDDLSADVRELIEDTSHKAATYFSEELGAKLPAGTIVVASGDAEFIARQYMKDRGIGSGLSQWTRTWSQEREAEGAYGSIFIRTSGRHFNTDYGVGIDNQRRRMIVHELFHVLQYELVGPRARSCCEPNNRIPVVGPIWMMEGAAQYIMYRFEHHMTRRPYGGWFNWAANERRKFDGTLADLETRNQMSQHQLGYEYGAQAVHQLVQRNGLTSLAEYWRAISDGQSWEQALETAFGRSKEAVYSAF